MQSVTDETFFTGSMRFRSFAGGGGIWQIAESFMRIGTAFQNSEGQRFVKAHPAIARQKFEIPGYWDVQTSKGIDPNDPQFTATNIPGDQEEEHSLDVVVQANGDVRITMRNPRLGEMGVRDGTAYLPEESMVLKSAKNDGSFPAVNATLAELARKLTTAKKRDPGRFDKAFA